MEPRGDSCSAASRFSERLASTGMESGDQSANQHESCDGCDHDAVNADRFYAHHVAGITADEPSESRVGESEACCSSDGEKHEPSRISR